jgi:hypothetical protein
MRRCGPDSIAFHSTGVGAESQLNNIRRHSQASCRRADVAQMAEQLTCNQQVAGSIPAVGFGRQGATARCLRNAKGGAGGRACSEERRKRASFGTPTSFERARGEMPHDRRCAYRGSSSVGRASAFQAERRGFDSRLPLSNVRVNGTPETRAKTSRVPRIGASAATSHGAVLPVRRRSGARSRGGMPHAPRSRSAQVAQSAEHVLGKDEVGGSIPLLGLLNTEARESVERRCGTIVGAERYPSGQREQTVNLPAYAFGGSNPPLSIGDDGYGLQATGYRKGIVGSLPEASSPKPVAPWWG